MPIGARSKQKSKYFQRSPFSNRPCSFAMRSIRGVHLHNRCARIADAVDLRSRAEDGTLAPIG
jgi:hypothetical protein